MWRTFFDQYSPAQWPPLFRDRGQTEDRGIGDSSSWIVYSVHRHICKSKPVEFAVALCALFALFAIFVAICRLLLFSYRIQQTIQLKPHPQQMLQLRIQNSSFTFRPSSVRAQA